MWGLVLDNAIMSFVFQQPSRHFPALLKYSAGKLPDQFEIDFSLSCNRVGSSHVVNGRQPKEVAIDWASQQKPRREMLAVTGVINQEDLKDIYRIFHPNNKEYTFFSTAHGAPSKTGHLLGHKPSPNR